MKRIEASIEEWKALYEVATRIKEQKPWEYLHDLDLIGIENKGETTYFSILGRGGDCYGIVAYEGDEGLNDFLMLTMQEYMNISPEYAMASQRNLTCYWGNREELSDKQRRIIKDLGYKYRGKNQWLYFISYEPGYFPYNLDRDEVLRMTEHLRNLEFALHCYDQMEYSVDFENGNMFCLTLNDDEKSWNYGQKALPTTEFYYGVLELDDKYLISELQKAAKIDTVLEVDIVATFTRVDDKDFRKPGNPFVCLIGDAIEETLVGCDLTRPEDNPIEFVANGLISYILSFGAPRAVYVTNPIISAGIEHICNICGISIKLVDRLGGLEELESGLMDILQ